MHSTPLDFIPPYIFCTWFLIFYRVTSAGRTCIVSTLAAIYNASLVPYHASNIICADMIGLKVVSQKVGTQFPSFEGISQTRVGDRKRN